MAPYKTPDHICECGNHLNFASSTDATERPPEEGDITMCAYCGIIYVYKADGTISEAMMSDINQLEPHQRDFLLMAQRTIMNTTAILNKPLLPS